MDNKRLTHEQVAYLYSLEGTMSSESAVDEMFNKFGVNLTSSAIRYQWRKYRKEAEDIIEGLDVPYGDEPSSDCSMTIAGDTMSVFNKPSEDIDSIDKLLNHSGVNLKEWEVEKYTINKMDKPVRDEEGAYRIKQLIQIRANLKRIPKQIDYHAIGDEIKEEILNMKYPNVGKKTYVGGDNMLLLNIFDAHIGKLAYADEVGEEYNVGIATKLFLEAATSIILRASRDGLSKIVIPIGNDLFNADNLLGTTTGGTPQDNDGLYRRNKKIVRQLIVDTINIAREYAQVEILTIPGNHDYQSVFELGDVLEVMYNNDPNITIVNNGSPRKYVLYGNSLLGFTHGSEEKIDRLPLTMMRECGEMMPSVKYMDWYLGHIHTSKHGYNKISDELGGVHIHFESSISGTDSWHHKKGYVGNRKGARGVVYSLEDGPIAIYPFNV